MSDIQPIVDSLNAINSTLQKSSGAFWNSQLFAALIGAVSATIIGVLINIISNRRSRLKELYDNLMDRISWYSPDSLMNTARITSYGHSSVRDGVTTIIPEKTNAEKIVIELRRRGKYWKWPICRVKFLFRRYEQALSKLPDSATVTEVKASDEYKAADFIYKRILELVQDKTGENQWTNRP